MWDEHKTHFLFALLLLIDCTSERDCTTQSTSLYGKKDRHWQSEQVVSQKMSSGFIYRNSQSEQSNANFCGSVSGPSLQQCKHCWRQQQIAKGIPLQHFSFLSLRQRQSTTTQLTCAPFRITAKPHQATGPSYLHAALFTTLLLRPNAVYELWV